MRSWIRFSSQRLPSTTRMLLHHTSPRSRPTTTPTTHCRALPQCNTPQPLASTVFMRRWTRSPPQTVSPCRRHLTTPTTTTTTSRTRLLWTHWRPQSLLHQRLGRVRHGKARAVRRQARPLRGPHRHQQGRAAPRRRRPRSRRASSATTPQRSSASSPPCGPRRRRTRSRRGLGRPSPPRSSLPPSHEYTPWSSGEAEQLKFHPAIFLGGCWYPLPYIMYNVGATSTTCTTTFSDGTTCTTRTTSRPSGKHLAWPGPSPRSAGAHLRARRGAEAQPPSCPPVPAVHAAASR